MNRVSVPWPAFYPALNMAVASLQAGAAGARLTMRGAVIEADVEWTTPPDIATQAAIDIAGWRRPDPAAVRARASMIKVMHAARDARAAVRGWPRAKIERLVEELQECGSAEVSL